jgi:hypothetical protein
MGCLDEVVVVGGSCDVWETEAEVWNRRPWTNLSRPDEIVSNPGHQRWHADRGMRFIATKTFRVELGRYKIAASFGSDVRVQGMQAKWKGGYGYISYSEEQLGQVSVGQYWWMDRSWGIHLSLFVLEFLSLVDDVFEDADGVEDDPPTGSSTTSTTLTIVSPPISIPAPTIPTPGMVWYPSLSAALPCHNLALNHAPTDSPGKGLMVSTRCSVTRPETGEKVYRDEVCQDVGCGEGL